LLHAVEDGLILCNGLSQRDDLTVIVTGGILRGSWFSLVGSAGIHTVGDMFTDKVFVGVDGIQRQFGLTSHYPDEAHTAEKFKHAYFWRVGVEYAYAA
jgi:DeoR/GlpR family transcriptional regulator of sugar metabolism